MTPCQRCNALIGRPGHVPPHPALVAQDGAPSVEGQRVFSYACAECGQNVMLVFDNAEALDVWQPVTESDG